MGKHQRTPERSPKRHVGRFVKRLALVGAATATVAVLTVASVPPPAPQMLHREVTLAAAVKFVPPPDQIPDLTGGLGTAGYDLSQSIAAAILRAIVNNINFMQLAKAAGLDPTTLLQNLPANVLRGVLDSAPIDLTPILTQLLGLDTANDILGPALKALGITDGGGITTVTKLLGLLGIDLDNPLALDVPGLKLITTGPPFTLLKLLGLDLGWTPALPNSVAAEINSTQYFPIGVNGLLTTVLDKLTVLDLGNPLLDLGGLVGALDNVVKTTIPKGLDVIDLRVPIVVGFGLGAFAAGAAYPKVVEQLPYQPGGAKSPTAGQDPLLGSLTILPMLLLRNPGRANGGLFARAYPFARLFGIDTVTPETQVTSSGGIPIGNTGLSLGGANLVPIKVDATVEYDLLSDFPAWPNAFSLANSLMGFLLPTYILRGVDTSKLTPQLTSALSGILGNVGTDPLALNLYLTLPTNSLPLLEPLYLLTDLTNLLTLGAFPNPLGTLANALSPALTSLVNLGYTDVVRMPDGSYVRTLDQAGDPTAFGSLSKGINWGQVPGDIVNQLFKGIEKEFYSGHPTPGTPNALLGVFKLLSSLLGGGSTGGITDVINAAMGGFNPLAAAPAPAPEAKTTTVATSQGGTTGISTPAPTPASSDAVVDEVPPSDTPSTRASSTSTVPRPTTTRPTGVVLAAGPSASPNAPGPVGSVVGGVTSTVAGVTNTVGGVTGGVTNTVGGLTGGVANTVGGLTGGLGGLGKTP